MNRKVLVALLVGSVCLLLAGAASAGPVSDKLTAEELAKIKAGGIVAKDTLQEGPAGYAVAFGIMKFKSVEEFWTVTMDYEHYVDFFPKVKYCTVIKKTQSQSLAEFGVDLGVTTAVYTGINTIAGDRQRMDWTMDKSRPHKFFSACDGWWILEELEPGVWLVEYKMDVKLDFGVLSKAANKAVAAMAKKDLPRVIENVGKRIESGGTWTDK